MLNFATARQETLCGRCQAIDTAAAFYSVEEFDKQLAKLLDDAEELEAMIADFPQMPDLPDELEAIASTPISLYRNLQEFTAAFRTRRLELMTELDSHERLRYELKKAVENEDFERSAELRDQLAARRNSHADP